MPDYSKTDVQIAVRDHLDLSTPVRISAPEIEREYTILELTDQAKKLALVGTYDQLMEFGAQIMRAAMSWCLISGHSDWLGEEIQLQDGGAQINVG